MNPDPQSTRASDAAALHLIVGVRQHKLAIPLTAVREILMLPHVVAMPGAPPHLRGFIDLRGGVLPTLDLRRRLGAPGREHELEEIRSMLQDRAEDHRNWLHELEACVRERRAFTLPRDPHLCRFGKWFYGSKPEDLVSEFQWSSLEEPHRCIHAIADEVLEMVGRGDEAGALTRIQQAKGAELRAMLDLFADAQRAVRNASRELAVIIDTGHESIAVTVDLADGITEVRGSEETDLAALGLDSAEMPLQRTARREDTGDTLLVLDVTRLIGTHAGPGAGRVRAA